MKATTPSPSTLPDATVASDEKAARLRVRRHIVIGSGGPRVALAVFCPRQLRSTHLDECRRCPRAACIEDKRLTCTPGVEPMRGESLVGAALGEASISVESTATLAELAARLEEPTWIAAAVLDADQRAVGLLHREQLAHADPSASASSVAHALAPVRESELVMTVVQRMVHERARALAVVDASCRTVGVLTDLDALRWAAARRNIR